MNIADRISAARALLDDAEKRFHEGRLDVAERKVLRAAVALLGEERADEATFRGLARVVVRLAKTDGLTWDQAVGIVRKAALDLESVKPSTPET